MTTNINTAITGEFFDIARAVNESQRGSDYFAVEDNKIKEALPVRWYIVALLVAGLAVAVVGGGFGITGLLHSHGVVTLPQSWLTHAISTVGNTPHFWSLYAIAIGSVVGGTALVVYTSMRIHHMRELREISFEINEDSRRLYNTCKRVLEDALQTFTPDESISGVTPGKYRALKDDKNAGRFNIVYCAPNSQPMVSASLTHTALMNIVNYLEMQGYEKAQKLLPFSQGGEEGGVQ